MRLLSHRVQISKHDEVKQIVLKRQADAVRHAQYQIEESWESFCRWKKKEKALQEMRVLSEQYLKQESSVSKL
jgi:hypothetical protein